MITIALAGGTSPGLGRSIVNAIQNYPDQLKCVVLSRASSKSPRALEEMGIEVRKVDYSSEESLYQALQGVHTIISVMLAVDGTWVSSQVNLLNAGLRAGISRFAPAEFGAGPLAATHIDMLKPTIEVMDACREVKRNIPDFEYASFHLGLFMNYLGYGAPNEEEATHRMNDNWVCVWDVKNMKAAIPLTKEGEVPSISMMEIGDVGRFVAAACLLPKGSWQEDFGMVGEIIRLDDVVKIIEKVRGRKMEVSYRPYEQIVQEERDAAIVYPNKFWLQIEEMQARNEINEGIVRPVLNELCTSVQPISVKQYMTSFWSSGS